ncbi:muconolactone Delta-isomerase [Pseudonocardia xinjiangensis]|uniref:muconolactone Delta-isomerase n=1 Tax=Pseudonocardia xinjiangensis TaxID=75289 RepID=UPI003D907FBE
MLYAVRMDVAIPSDLIPADRVDLLARERAYSQELQRSGKWLYIWRVVGMYSNLSIFDVVDNDELHEILWGLPLFPYMTITVTPMAKHPSDIHAG